MLCNMVTRISQAGETKKVSYRQGGGYSWARRGQYGLEIGGEQQLGMGSDGSMERESENTARFQYDDTTSREIPGKRNTEYDVRRSGI